MSLASTAALWTTDNNKTVTRKRVSTIRRPVLKDKSEDSDSDQEIEVESDIQNTMPVSIEETSTHNASMSNRVNTLLSQLTSGDDGNHLADYEPIPQPEVTINRKDVRMELAPPTRFIANDINLAKLSNYNQTYTNQRLFQPKPMTSVTVDDKLTEKINYMIRLLEEQQYEKTANITEEFVLYTLLGVFVIFTIDSFTRAGKYVR